MPLLRTFARDAQQAVHLVIYDRNVLVVVAQVDSPGYWNVSVRVGSRIGLINTGSGHVFLAYASPEERALMLEDPVTRRAEALAPGLEERLDGGAGAGFRAHAEPADRRRHQPLGADLRSARQCHRGAHLSLYRPARRQ